MLRLAATSSFMIQSIRLNDEIVLVRKALVLIVLSLVAAFLVRQFAGEM